MSYNNQDVYDNGKTRIADSKTTKHVLLLKLHLLSINLVIKIQIRDLGNNEYIKQDY